MILLNRIRFQSSQVSSDIAVKFQLIELGQTFMSNQVENNVYVGR